MTLDQHVKLDVPIGDLAVHEPDHKLLVAFLKGMEFNTLTRRVAEYAGIEAGEIDAVRSDPPKRKSTTASQPAQGALALGSSSPAPHAGVEVKKANGGLSPKDFAAARAESARKNKIDRSRYETVRSAAQLGGWIAHAREAGVAAISTKTTSDDPMQAELCGIALAIGPNEACYVPLSHRQGGEADGKGLFAGERAPDQIDETAALNLLKPLLEDEGVLKVAQNLKFDQQIIAVRGVGMRSGDDATLISYVLDAGRAAHGRDSLSEHWLDHRTIHYGEVVGTGKSQVCFDQVPIDKATEFAAEDADVTLRLWRVLQPRLVAESMMNVYETLERPLVPVLAAMERRGISIDRDVLSRLSGEFAQRAAGLEAEIVDLAGEPMNPGSPKQLGDILFGKMGLPGGKKTKTGAWSTSASVLEELAEEGHALPQKILDWRQVSKLKSTYTDALPGFVNPRTKRVHTSYALAATTTGRLSSSDPNLQNIPIRTEEGRKIRRAFIADRGMKLVSADYSQIELRLLAEIANIEALKTAFRDGLDIHAMTASEMFDVPVKDMPREVRSRAKAINFGIIYGISAFGLANQLGIPREEAGAYIKKYFERFPAFATTWKKPRRSAATTAM